MFEQNNIWVQNIKLFDCVKYWAILWMGFFLLQNNLEE